MSDETRVRAMLEMWLASEERALREALADATVERDVARADRDRLAAALADLVGAIEGRGQCWEHADACCREWCSRCQTEVEGDARLDVALARAKEER